MRLDVPGCDLGLARGRMGCSVDLDAPAEPAQALSARPRVARAIAGLAFLALAAPAARRRPLLPLGLVAGWFGASHLVAGATGFRGCPELGAIASLLLRREVATRCDPWEWIDARL